MRLAILVAAPAFKRTVDCGATMQPARRDLPREVRHAWWYLLMHSPTLHLEVVFDRTVQVVACFHGVSVVGKCRGYICLAKGVAAPAYEYAVVDLSVVDGTGVV